MRPRTDALASLPIDTDPYRVDAGLAIGIIDAPAARWCERPETSAKNAQCKLCTGGETRGKSLKGPTGGSNRMASPTRSWLMVQLMKSVRTPASGSRFASNGGTPTRQSPGWLLLDGSEHLPVSNGQRELVAHVRVWPCRTRFVSDEYGVV